jgi:putative ABC transport system substrate-binding protein
VLPNDRTPRPAAVISAVGDFLPPAPQKRSQEVAAKPDATRSHASQALPLVGWLCGGRPSSAAEILPLVRSGLAERGYIEGRNIVIESRFANGKYELLPALAADLIRLNAAVLIPDSGTVATPAALAASPATPIIFISGVAPSRSAWFRV